MDIKLHNERWYAMVIWTVGVYREKNIWYGRVYEEKKSTKKFVDAYQIIKMLEGISD